MHRVSVVMASYNGEKFIKEQVDSILKNLQKEDELIISDDGSTDKTLELLEVYKDDSRVKIIEGPKKGVKANFENALRACSGEYIFLSDQDDIWVDNKIDTVLPYLRNFDVVVHDCSVVDSTKKTLENSFFAYRKCGTGILKNILKNTYIGCCMAFNRKLLSYILPIPNNIEMHDQWIGIIGEKYGKGNIFISDNLLQYRRHDKNESSLHHYPLRKMFTNRKVLIINYFKRIKEVQENGKICTNHRTKFKILAIYLPAFHRIKENDEWWGPGFTEWDNVRNAKKYFKKHIQPIEPMDDYYYDLSRKKDIEKQIDLANKYMVDGFIFYHYWFGNDKKLFEKPAEILKDKIKATIGYCFCWANESWITTWHGQDPKQLMPQVYEGKEDWKKHILYFLPFFKDSRYIKINDRPILFIYKPNEIPDYENMIDYWNKILEENDMAPIYIIEYISSKNRNLYSLKSDAVVEFEPLYTTFFDITIFNKAKRFICKKLHVIDFQNYNKLWKKIINRKRTYNGKPIFRGCFSGWDNSPRKEKNSMIVKGCTPVNFEENFRKLVHSNRKDANEFIVINAWNEWSEGAMLEPTKHYQYEFLEAIKTIREEENND